MTIPSREKCLALVLRTVDFSETSRIVTLLTRQRGRLQVMAKGARRLRGAFGSSLELLSLCRIVVMVRAGDSLDLATEAELVDSFPHLRRDLTAMYSGMYMAEIVAALTIDYDPYPALFDAARTLLARLGPGGPPELLFAFELLCLEQLGYQPALDRCALCQRPVAPGESAYFEPSVGGTVCRRCRSGVRRPFVFGSEARAAMATLATGPLEAAGDVRLRPAVRREIRALLGHYFSSLMGRRPKTLNLLIAAAPDAGGVDATGVSPG